MQSAPPIPSFALYGETAPFPDVIHCERYSARAEAAGWRIGAHRHGQIAQLFLVAQGRIDAVLDGAPRTLRNGEFLFVPAHCVHEFVFEPDTNGDVISVPTSVLSSVGPVAEGVLAALARPFSGSIDARLAALAEMLKNVAATPSAFRAPQAVGLAHTVLSHLAEIASSRAHAPAPPLRLSALEALIKQTLAEGWRAAEYAAALSITPGHLSRICRRATGLGAAAYIEHRRMEEACRMLAFTPLQVSQIAYRLGYSDPSHFSKRFRTARGQTPSAYRAAIRGERG